MATRAIIQKVSAHPTLGETAGRILRTLEKQGPLRLTTLQRRMEIPAALLHMALGWLAREDKVEVVADDRSYLVRLR
jgi:DNA-binding IclR family transcriptional regulator